MTASTPTPEHIGPYRVVRPIARGGMAEVYEVTDPSSGEHLALKLLVQAGSALPRFNREYEAMTRLNHPSIVRVYHYGLHQGAPWLTMELLDGVPLQKRVKDMGRPGSEARTQEVMRIGYHVSDALQYIHDRGLVHRDLKSANCIVLPDGRVKLLDFGTAHLRDPVDDITQDGEFVGTFAYASPEQLTGQTIDHRSDLYSFGVLLYRLATGRRPFDAKDPHALAKQHLKQAPRPPRELVPELPADLERVILALLEKHRDRRPQRAEEIARALEVVAGRSLAPLPNGGITVRSDKAVGRDRELGIAMRALGPDEPGRGILVVGPEGSGRVVFGREVASAARADGWRVLQLEFRRTDSVLDLVRCVRDAAPGTEHAKVLSRLETREELEQPRRRNALRAAVVGALLHAAEADDPPLLFVSQQLHRANPIALELLVAMRRAAQEYGAAVNFMGTCDDSVEEASSPVRQRWPDAHRIALGPLEPRDAGVAIGLLLHRRQPPADLARRIHAAAGGQPGYIQEVVRQMVVSGDLEVHTLDGSRLRWGDRADAIPMPPSARSGVERALSALPLWNRRVLEALAVVGGHAEPALLAAGLQLDTDEIAPALQALEVAGWIEIDDLDDGEQVRFGRPLVEDALRDALHPCRRRVLEQALADALDDVPPLPGHVDVLLATGRVDDAVDRGFVCANRLMDEGRPAEALAVLEKVVPYTSQAESVPADERAALHLLHTSCLMMLRPRDMGTARSLMRAAQLATGPELEARVALTKARLQWVIGHYPNFRKILLLAWERLSEVDLPRLSSVVASHLAMSHLWGGQARAAQDWTVRCHDAAVASDNPLAVAYADVGLANLCYAQGDLFGAEEAVASAMQRFQRVDHRPGLWDAMVVWVNLLRQQGRLSEALQELYRQLPLARIGQVPSQHLRLLLATALCELDLCRLGRAQECIDELDVTIRKGEYLHLRVEAGLVRGRILLASGQRVEAARVLGEIHQQARTAGLVVASEQARALYAEAQWELGEYAEARSGFEGAMLGLLGTGDVSAMVDACVSRARVQWAEVPAFDLFQPVQRALDTQPMRVVQLEQLLAQARWHRIRGERAEAAPILRKAAALLNRLASHLNDTDRAALRVHPWSQQIRVGLR